jgi:hypothetical protein
MGRRRLFRGRLQPYPPAKVVFAVAVRSSHVLLRVTSFRPTSLGSPASESPDAASNWSKWYSRPIRSGWWRYPTFRPRTEGRRTAGP